MKRTILLLSLGISSPAAFAQGTVWFVNTPATLVSAGPTSQSGAISGAAGSYYFGLLTAPAGTADPALFSFTGVYATNTTLVGRLDGEVPTVPGWAPGTVSSFLVAGWSASLGPAWNQAWMSGSFQVAGFFGLSSIGTGSSGGNLPGPAPPLPLFGPASSGLIENGWNLSPVPEPSVAALLGLAAASLAFCKYKND